MRPEGRFEEHSFISGIGRSETGRRLGRTSLALTMEAALQAIADAGLTPGAIDGLATWPGEGFGPPGFAGPGVATIQDALRLELNWFESGAEGINMLGFIGDAAMAVASGVADHVLAVRTVTESSALAAASQRGFAGPAGSKVPEMLQWSVPFGVHSAVHWAALTAQRYFHEYGITAELLANVALNQRANALANPLALMRDPMTLDDYMASRMIATPLRLFDCDVPADGSFAFVISRRDYVADCPATPVEILAIGSARRTRAYWELLDDLTRHSIDDAAAHMWSRSDLGPEDVDVAQLYDGFSIFTLLWLEALGFCERGTAAQYLAPSGQPPRRPLNTSGGQLSEGRFVGSGLLYEACLQLRGEADGRQVVNAEVAAVGVGAGVIAHSLLLARCR